MNDEERVVLTPEQAEAMLPDEPYIHTFRQAGMVLIGADWSRKSILDAIQKHRCELAGPAATAMNHGLVIFDGEMLFVETMKERAK